MSVKLREQLHKCRGHSPSGDAVPTAISDISAAPPPLELEASRSLTSLKAATASPGAIRRGRFRGTGAPPNVRSRIRI